MPAQFEFHTKKVLTLFLLPMGVLVAYLAYSVVTAGSRVAAIQDDARRQAAMHSLTVLTALSLVCLVGVLAVIFLIVRNAANTELGESGLSRRGLFGRTSLQWSEVTEVKRYKSGAIRLSAASGSLLIPVGYYRHPQFVSAYIAERLKSLSRVRQ